MQRGQEPPNLSSTRQRAVLIIGAALTFGTGCSAVGGGNQQRLTGEFEVLIIADVVCERYPFALNIKDGAGKVLRHLEGETSADGPQVPGGGTSCTATYSAEVPQSSVYVIESERYPKADGGLFSKTVDAAAINDGKLPKLSTVVSPFG